MKTRHDFVVYRSQCCNRQFDIGDLDILRTALAFNPTAGITGFLLRIKTHYFQEIEGPRGAISALIDRIKTDQRHLDFKVLCIGRRSVRDFAGWDMGYSQSSNGQFHTLETTPSSFGGQIMQCLRHESWQFKPRVKTLHSDGIVVPLGEHA